MMKTKILITLLLSCLLWVWAIHLFANDTVTKFRCGEVSLTIYNSNVVESPYFVITLVNGDGAHYFTFPASNQFLALRCERGKGGKEFLLINHTCSGSACSESNYGLIELNTGKEVLKPGERYRGNSDKAEAILGKTVRPFSCSKRSKTSTVPNDKGEYCFVSPLILN